MERPIGEIFSFKGKKFEIVEGSCTNNTCCFKDVNCLGMEYSDLGGCLFREDGKTAYFKLIN